MTKVFDSEASKQISSHYLLPDGTLRVAQWAYNAIFYTGSPLLFVCDSVRPLQMANSDATAECLLTNGNFGADIIRFPAGGCVKPHTHPGDHLLFVLAGTGRLMHLGREYPLLPGACYLMPGRDVHAIDAETNLVLLSIANQHIPADASARLQLEEPDAHNPL